MQGNASAIEDLCSLLRSSSLRSSNEDDSLQPPEQQNAEALHLQDPAGLTALLEDLFTIEDRLSRKDFGCNYMYN